MFTKMPAQDQKIKYLWIFYAALRNGYHADDAAPPESMTNAMVLSILQSLLVAGQFGAMGNCSQ